MRQLYHVTGANSIVGELVYGLMVANREKYPTSGNEENQLYMMTRKSALPAVVSGNQYPLFVVW